MSLVLKARAEANEALGNEPKAEGLRALADKALAFFDRVHDANRATTPPIKPLACGNGCSWCCYLHVAVGAPEVFRIADHVVEHRTPEQLEVLKQRLQELLPRIQAMPLGQQQLAKEPCALLEAGRCSVYPVRPLACRSWNSFSEEECRDSLEDAAATTECDPMPLEVHGCVFTGVDLALRERGLGTEVLELNHALLIALTEPKAKERWLAGEKVFAAAVVDRVKEMKG